MKSVHIFNKPTTDLKHQMAMDMHTDMNMHMDMDFDGDMEINEKINEDMVKINGEFLAKKSYDSLTIMYTKKSS